KSFLILKIPDPPNYNKFETDMVDPEYTPGATPGSENVIRRKRKYKIDWRQRFSANEINLIESASDTLPDGATQGGGTVVSGVVSDLFTVSDMLRK
ncbi:MAG: hypothetical protein HKN35_15730, partial [Woeseia sp.]|nr:hypothetical protein [Woeseia sp.]